MASGVCVSSVLICFDFFPHKSRITSGTSLKEACCGTVSISRKRIFWILMFCSTNGMVILYYYFYLIITPFLLRKGIIVKFSSLMVSGRKMYFLSYMFL